MNRSSAILFGIPKAMNRTKTACRAVGVVFYLITLVASAMCPDDSPVPRAEELLRNIHIGRQMRAADWLSKDILASDVFTSFGGLKRLVQQTTSLASDYGGLKSVVLLSVKKEKAMVLTFEVKFNECPKDASLSAAETEPMIWTMHATRDVCVWKYRF